MEKPINARSNFQFSSDECGVSGGEADSDEDVVTEYQVGSVVGVVQKAAEMRSGQSGTHGPLPTISVTPHSPANKSYPILEDTLRQIRDLSESVHQMRHQNSNSKDVKIKEIPISALNPFITQIARLSASCPALNEIMNEIETMGGSLGSSPMHGPPSRKNSGAQDWLLCRPEINNRQRRRSWTALEDLRENGSILERTKQKRQRSISLSSMESEADESLWDNVDGSTVRLLGPERPGNVTVRRVNRTSGGGASTHSLNEADLQNDFNKLKAKREAEQLRLLPQRLPLQKSISTPSIIAAGDLAVEPALVGVPPALPAVGYDRHSEKRRKRGSLFFRKKKDKSKKMHQWVSACYGSSHVCDCCNKILNNKPALYCECCGTTVHQNGCKDNIGECAKPKGMKSVGKLGSFGMPLPNTKISMSKRGSGSLVCNSTSQILMGDDKDNDHHHGHHDATSFPDDVPLVPLEFSSDSPLTASDLCNDHTLGLNDNEPESWSSNVGKEITKKLKEKEVKRQEHIYEFILTEKHHCMTLLVMQKIFVEGLQKHFQLGASLERMFPRLSDLIEIHLGFLSRLRQRQKEGAVVTSIADILLDMFSELNATKLKSAYGEFCSRHRYAVEIYKYYYENDTRFGRFVRHCQQNPLLKKKGIPECILFVTQRLTKYPLLIEPLIKTSKDNKIEQETLQKSLILVKEILVEVDAQVAEKEKEDRKLEIYNRIDAKSYTSHRGYKFKKSDILQGNRLLKFEGVAMLMQGRGKMQPVLVIVLSDVLFFLQENSSKYSFFTPDNKAGVVSLQKLLVREKAGQDSRGIYLISSNPADPEMFELKIHKPKDKQTWIQAIRKAVQTCPEDEEDFSVNSDEKMILLHKQNQIKHIVGLLRQKDIEQALLLEEKMSLQLKLMTISGIDPPSPPTYRHLVNENVDNEKMWKEVLMAVQEVTHLASSLYATGTNLSRSVSSAGEHQSDTYVSPVLPKRAETFGGFDNSNQNSFKLFRRSTPQQTNEFDNLKPNDLKLYDSLPYRNFNVTSLMTNGNNVIDENNSTQTNMSSEVLLTLGRDQQYAAIQLSHYVYTLLCIISQLMTTNECLLAETSSGKSTTDGTKQYKHNQQLEELRNLQDKLSKEKSEWNAQKEQETKELDEKRKELQRIQEQIKIEQADIKQQREQLYRKMEILTSQGLLISPNIALPVTSTAGTVNTVGGCQLMDETSEENSPLSDSSTTSNSNSHGTTERRKDKWQNKNNQTQTTKSHNLPMNLISTTNQYKVSQNTTVKQQLPLKLASRLSTGNVTVGSGSGGGGIPQSISVGSMSGIQQVLPLKLQQEEKERRISSSSGYQRLGSDSFSPTSGETTPTLPSSYHAHSRTGSSPALMQQQLNSPTISSQSNSQPESPIGGSFSNNKTTRTNTYPKFPDKFRVRQNNTQQQQQQQQQKNKNNTEEEVIYF